MPLTFLQQFRAARRAGAPLVRVRTPDPSATILSIVNDDAMKNAPIILWDAARGCLPVGEKTESKNLARLLLGKRCQDCNAPVEPILIEDKNDPKVIRHVLRAASQCSACSHRSLIDITDTASLASPIDMLMRSAKMPDDAILFMSNLHLHLKDPVVLQCIWNLRDSFKQNTRTLVLLGCDEAILPPELAQDVLTLDEPLPDAKKLEQIVSDTYTNADLSQPKKEIAVRAVDALCGLSAFTAEQVCSMSISKDGLDLEQLWERKRQQIEQTPGLSVYRGKETFDDVKGCANIIDYLSGIMGGQDPPACVIFSDEIEKMFAGMSNDQDSVTKEMVGAWLTWCETKLSNGEPKVVGLILVGPPGTGKSMLAKALGNQFKRPTIIEDLSAMKGSLVGQSQANFNMATKVIDAVSGDKPVLLITTCNRPESLPPEVQRRLSFGTFFIDLPTVEGRELMWKMYMDRYKLTDKERPQDSGWTGAEIRNCCMISRRLGRSLVDASKFIVPVSVNKKEMIEELRRNADKKFISANYAGLYNAPPTIEEEERPMVVAVAVVPAPKRKINTDKGNGGKGMAN